MKRNIFQYLVVLLMAVACQQNTSKATLTDAVDPFIGTGGHGHTFPGAVLPFGMLQVSPDNGIAGWDWCSGYHHTDSITIGFSHLHLSGTGIGDLADIRLMPVNKKVDLTKVINDRDDIPYASKYRHDKEIAKPGYYQVFLEDFGIDVGLTTDPRTALHRYRFKKEDTPSVVLDLDVTFNWDKTLQGEIFKQDAQTISGYRYSKGWAKNQKVFFVIHFSQPIKSMDLVADGNWTNEDKATGNAVKAQFFFNPLKEKPLLAKVAISSVDVLGARANLSASILGFDFEQMRQQAEETWEQSLSKIKIVTDDATLKRIFYTALYHAQIAPAVFNDADRRFRMQNDSIVKTDFTVYSTLSLWDTFRAAHPLFTLIAPSRVGDFVKSMLLYYAQHQRLPVWTLYGNETNTMTGYHAIPVIAEAIIKGLGDFDKVQAYQAMKATMMQDDRDLKSYKKYGYIPFEEADESVTKTLEYAYNDWCVTQIAHHLGKKDDEKFFKARSLAYRYLFDKEMGFMRGKSKDGISWHVPFDPKRSEHRVGTDYTEGNAWQHSWFVLHEPDELIKLHGKQLFLKRLEQLFTENSTITGNHVSADISGLIGQYAHGNEPSHHIAYLFNFAGQPWRTQYWVRHILKTQYKDSPDGLSGNEDCGQMSAWYVWSSLGLYPYNPAFGIYQITSPLFKKSTLKVGEGKTFEIIAENLSPSNIYIQSATLNGDPLNKTEISHQTLLKGGVLKFVMGAKPNTSWGV